MIELQKKSKYNSSLNTSLLTVGVHAVLDTYTVKLFESNFEMVQKLSRSEEGAGDGSYITCEIKHYALYKECDSLDHSESI